jgi:hypothetical protein
VLIETNAKEPAPKAKKGSQQPWHAVMVTAPSGACAAAHACKGRRYLSSEAPQLPLPDCTAKRCECKYRHFADRRGDSRREDGNVAPPAAREQTNRRKSRGRRVTD